MTERVKALTKAMYHMAHAKLYFEAFKIEAEKVGRHNVRNWLNKISFIENDAMSIMSDDSRSYFRQEIMRGDVLFFGEVAEKFIHLTDQQRLLIEDLVNAMIKGESIIPVKEEESKSAA